MRKKLTGYYYYYKLKASGEAEYTTDIPRRPGELAAAYVLTTQVLRVILCALCIVIL